jgi:hypothetical protein
LDERSTNPNDEMPQRQPCRKGRGAKGHRNESDPPATARDEFSSGEDLAHDVPLDVGQSEITAGVSEGQPRVVDP